MVNSNAQSSYQFGLLPTLNVNKKFKNRWKVNLKLESRQILKEGIIQEKNNFDYQYALTDIALVASKKIGLNNAFAFGYLIRFREERVIHRSIQQFSLVKKYANFRMAHRFASDQSFEKNEDAQYRLRYRMAFEFPLNGQAIDTKEFYLKINNEYLNIFQNKNHDLEVRLVPLLGYVITDSNKIELGLDQRVNSFLDGDGRFRFWIKINWFVSF